MIKILNYHISCILCILDANNFHGREMPQKFPLNGFKWKKNVSKFDEGLIKDYDKIVIKDIFLK